jgi:hypothetical protein
MNRTLLATLALFALTMPGYAGLYREISIDGDFSDWAGAPVAASDPLGDSTYAVDFGDLYLANDDQFLYVRFTLQTGADPFTYLSNTFIDSDANSSTGFAAVGGLLGSEMLIQSGAGYQEKNGGFNEGGVNGLSFLSAGNGSQTDYEFRVSLNATFASDGTAVFSGSDLAILLETDDASFAVGDVLLGGVTYSIASVPEPSFLGIGASVLVFQSLRRRRRTDQQR